MSFIEHASAAARRAEAAPSIAVPVGAIPASAPAWNPQRGSAMPYRRYRPSAERVQVPLTGRTWPGQTTIAAPLWVPVDLRDGNQALIEPMDSERKLRAFQLMVSMGYKEIEVGYPSASSLDFDFVRLLVKDDLIPDDVSIVVFTPARQSLIARTFESIQGLPRAIVHMYAATAPAWREVVLGHDRDSLLALILKAGSYVLSCADATRGVSTRFEFSPEVFNLTEPDYVIEVCNAVTSLWDASPDRPVIHNLPTTVEAATPNVFADQIEWMDRNLIRRDSVILSVHPHNDRGTGVAAAELAMLAGAQRVEGCLFGNGERTGNVDLITLAMNLFSQGVDPMLDLSDIDAIRRTVEHCNGLPVHERHPYGGELVYTAFSGTHQDAIKKGFAHHEERASALGVPVAEAPWDVPYLPIDPADVGRSYEAVVRVNSQSGKGGVAYLLSTEYGLDLPRHMQIEFSRIVQTASESTVAGGEVTAAQIWDLFAAEYLDRTDPVELRDWWAHDRPEGPHSVEMVLRISDAERVVTGEGNGPLQAFSYALGQAGLDVEILGYTEHALRGGGDSAAAAYIECRHDGRTVWGVGIDTSVLAASVKALISAINRSL